MFTFDLANFSLQLTQAASKTLYQFLLQVLNELCGLFLLLLCHLLLRIVLQLEHVGLGRVFFVEVLLRMPAAVVLAEEVVASEGSVAVAAGDGLGVVTILRHFFQILEAINGGLQPISLFGQLLDLHSLLVKLALIGLALLIRSFVMEVQSASEALEVVLSVDEVLDAHLGELEELDEVVGESVDVFPFDFRIGNILK